MMNIKCKKWVIVVENTQKKRCGRNQSSVIQFQRLIIDVQMTLKVVHYIRHISSGLIVWMFLKRSKMKIVGLESCMIKRKKRKKKLLKFKT